MDFTKRSDTPELMDDLSLSDAELAVALNDIATVNKFLGGNKITVSGLKTLIAQHPEKETWTVVDVGCGDGEVLRYVASKFKDFDKKIHFIGMDINEKSIKRARAKSKDCDNLEFRPKNILTINEGDIACDVILCTLTLHHFSDEQIAIFLKKFENLAGVGIVINDLQRSKLAYQLFKLFSSIFMKSDIARHDGKVSIARSFKKVELEAISQRLGFAKDSIQWKWAFRYLWIINTL